MGSSDGLYWFHDGPDVIAQKLSVAPDLIAGQVGIAVSLALSKGVELMRQTVITGGVKNGISTGGPRILTGDMYSSIDGHLYINNRERTQAQFGYVNNAPFYALFQEYGTRSRHGGRDRNLGRPLNGGPGGIKPLHAFVAGAEVIARDLAVEISRVDIWKGFR